VSIDTENKRRSAQAGPAGTMRPVADGTIAAADRATAAWMYAGLTYEEPVVSTGFRFLGDMLPPPDWRWSTIRRPL
jgi:hypothetical protein